jgi:hypothetical protein
MPRVLRLTVPTLVALLLTASGCGSAKTGGSSPTTRAATSASKATQPKPKGSSPAQLAKRSVAAMVLTTGDLGSFRLQSRGGETLKEQLPPKVERHYAAVTRLVKTNWIASEHAILDAPDGKSHIFTNVNLFKSSSAAMAIWKLEADDGARHERRFATPAGAPAGAKFDYQWNPRRHSAVFQLGWQDGATMNFELAVFRFPLTFTTKQAREIGGLLSLAAQAQSRKIDSLVNQGSSSA